MYSKIILAFILMFSVVFTTARDGKSTIIPLPDNTELTTGMFVFKNKLSIDAPGNEMDGLIRSYKSFMNNFIDAGVRFSEDGGIPSIQLELEENSECNMEGYQLEISPLKMKVTAPCRAGLFYGLMSVAQLVMSAGEENGKKVIPCCIIKDQPRYAWRGLMLDESRHFFGKEKVKQLLDYMALHKLNKFHWHLTDVPGWRIEIKQYPKLTSVGGIGNYHDPNAGAKFYTQEDIAEIVDYAGERFIEIIPEIDMPGHATAANRAYPEFSGGGSEKYPEFTFHPGKEGTYGYLTNILKEVASLFPSEYIHLGGDEVHFGNHQWKTDPDVQKLMKVEGLGNLKEVEQYFVRRMADSIVHIGKKVIGWDEVTGSGLDPESTLVMWWRHDKPYLLDSAINNGYQLVLCPRIPLYFDFDQHETHKYGRRWGGAFCDIEKVYSFPNNKIDSRYNEKVIGIQANVWTERIQNNKRLDFMTFPRLSAMAEAAWTNEENKDYLAFMGRLKKMIKRYQKDNIYYFNPFDPEKTTEPEGIKK